jgi:hypothetical protein
VHFANAVNLARIEENSFGCSRLAGINVRSDADVPDLLERDSSLHKL